MKKLLLVTQYFPPSVGGIQTSRWQLVNRMPPEKVAVLTDDYGVDSSYFSDNAKYKIYYKKLFFRKLNFTPKWLPMIWHFLSVLIKEKPDIVWAAEITPVGFLALTYSKIFNFSYYMSTHGLDTLKAYENLHSKNIIKRVLMKQIFNNCKFVTANSEFTKGYLLKMGLPEDKIIFIYPSPNCYKELFSNKEMEETPNNSKSIKKIKDLKYQGNKIILSVGRLVERKGFDKTIQALPLILNNHPKTKYVVVGDGPYYAQLQNLVTKNKLEDSVLFTGKLSGAKLAVLYNISNIFIMPARKIGTDVEGFGVVYIEAGSFNTPVLGGRSGGISDAIIEFDGNNSDYATGLIIDNPADPIEISEKIIKLLDNDELAFRLGQNGIKWAKNFTWDKNYSRLKQKIEE